MSSKKHGLVHFLQEFSIPLIVGVFAALLAANETLVLMRSAFAIGSLTGKRGQSVKIDAHATHVSGIARRASKAKRHRALRFGPARYPARIAQASSEYGNLFFQRDGDLRFDEFRGNDDIVLHRRFAEVKACQ